jgi:hypothetical protein
MECASFAKARSAGMIEKCLNWGLTYEGGLGVEKNEKQALARPWPYLILLNAGFVYRLASSAFTAEGVSGEASITSM